MIINILKAVVKPKEEEPIKDLQKTDQEVPK
jgi:hypothetical protein